MKGHSKFLLDKAADPGFSCLPKCSVLETVGLVILKIEQNNNNNIEQNNNTARHYMNSTALQQVLIGL